MPSPFPGMDPYLESSLWQGFHGDLVTQVRWDLVPKLGPKYYPFSAKYLLIESQEDVLISTGSIYPDVGVGLDQGKFSAESTAILEAPVHMRARIPEEVPQYRIEIRDLANRQLVTVIEFLSPTNKYGSGRKKYLRKRRRLLRSDVHLVEIDLLLRGPRLPMDDPYPAGDYFVMLSRSEKRPLFDVWPIGLGEGLPTIPIPLLEGDPDVPLNLQEIFQRIYNLGGYQGAIDYGKGSEVALSDEQQKLVREILAKHRERSR